MTERLVKAPSHARTLLYWPPKAPEEAADYGLDWTDVLLSPAELAAGTRAPSDGIRDSSFVLPPGIVASASSNTSVLAEVTVTGGEAGRVYTITNRVVTSAGRSFARAVKLRVRAG